MTLSVAREVGNWPSFLDDTHAELKVRGIGVYAELFYYGLYKLSHEQTHCTNAFCILSVHEVGYQTADQSSLMIRVQLCNMYDSNLRSQ
jgi:hypothetical protein